MLRAALDGRPVNVYGLEYPTQDGSCIRDYVHVMDIAGAHVLALAKIDGLSDRIYNLGNAKGYSVLEVVETARRVIGINITVKQCPARSGDPAALVASSNRAAKELGWKSEYSDLENIIKSAWQWLKRHPNGYE